MQNKNSYLKKRLKIAGVILLLLSTVLFAVGWYLSNKYKPIITQALEQSVSKASNGLYRVKFSNVVTNVFTGHATFKNIQIEYDSLRYLALVKTKQAPNHLFKFKLKRLVVKKFKPLNVLFHNSLNIENLVFDGPEIVVIHKNLHFSSNQSVEKKPFDYIKNTINSLSIKHIDFKGASFTFIDLNNPKPKTLILKKIDFSLIDFLMDADSGLDKTRFYGFKDAVLDLKDYQYSTADSLYNFKIKRVAYKASTALLELQEVHYKPVQNEIDFWNALTYRRDRYDLKFKQIFVKGFDIQSFIKLEEIKVEEIVFNEGSVNITSNEHLKKKMGNVPLERLFPHQVLQKIKQPIKIKKAVFEKLRVSYSVWSAKTKQKGEIVFSNCNGLISNISNVTENNIKNPIMNAKVTTHLMGQGDLSINFNFYLLAKDGSFDYTGLLKGFNARLLNRITKPLGLLQINRGYVNKLNFSFKANQFNSKGQVNFDYYNLSVGLMRNDAEDGRLVKMGLMSFLANTLMIEGENPGVNGVFRTAFVEYDQVKNASIFNLMWKSLFQGVKQSVGLTNEKQAVINTKIAKFKSISEQRKARKKKNQE